MHSLPKTLPEYTIRPLEKEPFSIKWEELPGWFLIPKEGNALKWGIYDLPERTLSEKVVMKCGGKAEIHGIPGQRIDVEESQGKRKRKRRFIAELSDTHCRFLAESHEENGIEKTFTFLDGDAFLDNWGFGADNIGQETALKKEGLILRDGNTVTTSDKTEVTDVVGRYEVTINGKSYDTICRMDIGSYDQNTIAEQYIDQNGRTVLWRRFNKTNRRWNFDGHEEILDEKLRNNESLCVNGVTCFHWYDCITDYIL